MSRNDLIRLLDFHYWARNRVLEAVAALSAGQYTEPRGGSFASVRDTLNHLYSAEWIWLRRLNGESPTAPPSIDLPDLSALRPAWHDLEAQWRGFLDAASEASVGEVMPYRLLSGQSAASPLWQIVTHMVNHGTYHRGQVTTLLRQLGAKPPASTDLITYYREHAS
jgi:uncharacterized damage-inducible protein DinB